MLALIQLSSDWGNKYMVLQASELGLPLYKNLGFISQFTIRNYQKII
ncbi:hypothetical protein RS130_00990 [Paraglaciecola aquimarina]|uniref:Uncharacterized protein n=1 Tax=Paraglaciecola aquimarina TaxID=1235557 RepID=A0ABU3SRN1_9ALTE|nr:hypothetical protein [Paraglaciecola aquimarina]MDU0352676.1 hypothetical protein [Paraglaciecola aquimarina]